MQNTTKKLATLGLAAAISYLPACQSPQPAKTTEIQQNHTLMDLLDHLDERWDNVSEEEKKDFLYNYHEDSNNEIRELIINAYLSPEKTLSLLDKESRDKVPTFNPVEELDKIRESFPWMKQEIKQEDRLFLYMIKKYSDEYSPPPVIFS